ncbi:hypothetical protein Leryth_025539 [Lithospermum erythrorhizon]|nr:hypothetical protein Leryth_025539 [Lithospermum erythrorhizon]
MKLHLGIQQVVRRSSRPNVLNVTLLTKGLVTNKDVFCVLKLKCNIRDTNCLYQVSCLKFQDCLGEQ